MRMAEDGIGREYAGHPSDHPADRGVAEILIGDKGIDVDEVVERALQPLLGARPEEVMLVVAIERHHGIDRGGVHGKQDQLLRLLPRAIAAIQHQERFAVGADVALVELLLEEVRRRRRKVLDQLRGDRAARHQDHIAVGALDQREVVAQQADVVDVRPAAWRVAVMDEGEIGMRE